MKYGKLVIAYFCAFCVSVIIGIGLMFAKEISVVKIALMCLDVLGFLIFAVALLCAKFVLTAISDMWKQKMKVQSIVLGVFAAIGVCLAVIVGVLFRMDAYGNIESRFNAEWSAKRIEREFNTSGALQVNGIRVDSIRARKSTLNVYFRFDYTASHLDSILRISGLDLDATVDSMLYHNNKWICANAEMRNFLDRGGRFNFSYSFSDGLLLTQHEIGKCQ